MKMLISLMVAFSLATSSFSSESITLHERDGLATRKFQELKSSHPQVAIENGICTVTALGGTQDDSSALIYAFSTCSSGSRIELPDAYNVGRVLNTTLKNVEILLNGKILYTPDIDYWSPNSIFLEYQNATTFWLFQGSNVTLHGNGTIDGNGQVWWEAFATNKDGGVAGGSTRGFSRPIPLTVANAKDVVIQNVKIIQSPNWHNFVFQSSNVTYDNIFVSSQSDNTSAPASNTDGWDIYRSDHVTIKNSVVYNGDDCVSFKPNSTYINVENVYCNGSHGISVGSLGQYAGETDIVANVYVNNVTMINAQNGARIKESPSTAFGGSNDSSSISGGGSGYVKNITFSNFHAEKVDNPVVIDQCYFTSAAQCAQYPSKVAISDIHYIDVYGTSSGKVKDGTVVSLKCSASCVDITATGTSLSPPSGSAQYLCKNLADETLLDFKCTDVT